jgi:hypothetical protein
MHMVTEAQSAGGAEQAMFGTKIMATGWHSGRKCRMG